MITNYPCTAARPFHIPFTDGMARQRCLLSEDDRGPRILRRAGMAWLYTKRPSQEEVDEILAATGND